jgi:hypothetical protein
VITSAATAHHQPGDVVAKEGVEAWRGESCDCC